MISLYKLSYFPESHSRSKKRITVKLDYSCYATKSDLKSTTHIETSTFAKPDDLALLKQELLLFNQLIQVM